MKVTTMAHPESFWNLTPGNSRIMSHRVDATIFDAGENVLQVYPKKQGSKNIKKGSKTLRRVAKDYEG